MFVARCLRAFRVASIMLGFSILIIGVHSHKPNPDWKFESNISSIAAAKQEELYNSNTSKNNCPNAFLEQYYVAVVTVNFVFSFIGYICYILWESEPITFHALKFLDLLYHAISALVLVSAATLYILTSLRIIDDSFRDIHFTTEKLVAAILTIVLAFVHLIITFLVTKYEVPQKIQVVKL